jgi:hypothetical protein
MIPARAARMIAVCETRMDVSVRETIDGLRAIGADATPGIGLGGGAENRPAAPARTSEPERVVNLR